MKSGINNSYDIAKNLKLRTCDIINMNGLECSVKLEPSDFADIYEKPNRICDIILKLKFFIGSDEILTEGMINGLMEIQCSRCLKLFKKNYMLEFSETFSTNNELIDIMSIVRQTLIVSNEIRYLCSKDCKGLCRICGADLNKTDCACQNRVPSPFEVLKSKFKH